VNTAAASSNIALSNSRDTGSRRGTEDVLPELMTAPAPFLYQGVMKNAGRYGSAAGFLTYSLLYPPSNANKRRLRKSKCTQCVKMCVYLFSITIEHLFQLGFEHLFQPGPARLFQLDFEHLFQLNLLKLQPKSYIIFT
jgi:hypothetical protein